jgi:hypothetical protein
MKKRISSVLSLLLLVSAVGHSNDRSHDRTQRPALNGLGTPPQSHETSNLVVAEQGAKKTGPKQSVEAIPAGRTLGSRPHWLFGTCQPDDASSLKSAVSRVNSVRAPPVSVLAF